MKIKVITPDAAHGEAWTMALRQERAFEVALIVRDLHTVNVLVNGSRPDLVLVETTTPKDFEALQVLASAHPEIDYVLVGQDLSPEFLMRAMRAGVREVLPAPASGTDVLAALRRQLRKRPGTAAAPVARHGQVLGRLPGAGIGDDTGAVLEVGLRHFGLRYLLDEYLPVLAHI